MTVLRHAKKRTRAMTVAPRVDLVGLLGQGNDGSLEAVFAYLGAEHPMRSWISCAQEQTK